MKRFKSAGQAQPFLSAPDQINNLFHLRRDHVTAAQPRASRTQKFQVLCPASSPPEISKFHA
jgi:putative transposase